MEERKLAGTGMEPGRSGTVDNCSCNKSHRSGETEEELLKCVLICIEPFITMESRLSLLKMAQVLRVASRRSRSL